MRLDCLQSKSMAHCLPLCGLSVERLTEPFLKAMWTSSGSLELSNPGSSARLGWFLRSASTAWADWTQGENGTWKILIMGDHRGDNKAFASSGDPPVVIGYTDGGINKAVLADLARAARQEAPVFVLSVGDMATK